MSREIYHRDFRVNKVMPARERKLHSLASEVRFYGGHRARIIRFDAITDNPGVKTNDQKVLNIY